MRPFARSVVAPAALALAASAFPAPGSAQGLWFDPSVPVPFAIEVFSAEFKELGFTRPTATAAFVTVRQPISELLLLAFELPIARGAVDSVRISTFEASQTGVGNPYLGLEIGRSGSITSAEVGVRLPTMSEQKLLVSDAGRLADADRFEAFVPERATLAGLVNFRIDSGEGTTLRFRLGPTLLLGDGPTGTDGGPGAYLHYSAHGWMRTRRVELGGGVTGVAALTNEDVLPGSPTTHHVGAVGSLRLGVVQPGAHFRMPIGWEGADALDYVFGFHLSVRPPAPAHR